MKFGLQTSLLALFFAIGSVDAFAAPTVRALGAATTGTSTAASATNARAGSLRPAGGYVRPTTTTANPVSAETVAPANEESGTAVMVEGGTTGLNNRVSSSPRLSIGKYIGAPRTISTDTKDVTTIIERVETDRIEVEKQDKLQDTEYITVENNEVWLEFERLKDALKARDGREVELETTADGIVWRYVGESDWRLLVSWDELKSNLNITNINNSVTNMNTKVTNLIEDVTRIDADVSGKVDKAQGVANAGKALVVGADGNVTTGTVSVDMSGKVDKLQGTDYVGKAMVVDAEGYLQPTGEFTTTSDVTTIVNNVVNGIETDISGKVDIAQGLDNAGKALVVGADGNVTTGTIDLAELAVDLSGKVDIAQGDTHAGKVLTVNESGNVDVGINLEEALALKLNNTADAETYGGKALIVDATTGEITPTGEFVTSVDLSGKVDVAQGATNAGKVMTVDTDGNVGVGINLENALAAKLNNVADAETYGGKALIVDTTTGQITPAGEFVAKNQGEDNAGKALIVDDSGNVTTGRINTASLGLGLLAYKDKVANGDVIDRTLQRAKMAADITDTLYWIDRWRDTEPMPDDQTRYVMAVDEYGTKSWFRVVVDE